MIPMEYGDFNTATVDVVTGILEIHTPAGELADSPFGLVHRELSPWGAEEFGMERADEALYDVGWYRMSPQWTQSDAPASEWTCLVEQLP